MSLKRALHWGWLRARRANVLRILGDLERTERLPRDEVKRIQDERLSALLRHAARAVPYYREAFARAGVDPDRSAPREALAALPVLTKEVIRDRGPDLLSADAAARGATANATGGSTGVPLVFQQDDAYREHRQAAMFRGFKWCGWRVGGSLAYLWGSDVDSKAHRGLGALRDALFGITWIDAFTLEESRLDAHLRDLSSRDPEILIGYVSSLRHLARRALRTGRKVELRAVETSAELLTPDARAEIEEAFGCKVYDRYGCREAGVVAHECEAGAGWHVNAETTLVETEPDGRLLLTTLMNYSMPLVRYRNEDVVELGEGGCSCGRSLPLMRKIVGRRADIISSPSGRAIHGEFFTHLFYGQPGVREFQVYQRTLTDLVVRVVAGPEFTPEHRRKIEAAILGHGDPAFRVTWESLAEIPRTSSGKLRFTISALAEREGSR